MLANALPLSSMPAGARPSAQGRDVDPGDSAGVARQTRDNLEKTGAAGGIQPLTAEQAADNILGFIGRQLERDRAAGASAEELEARLQAGLRGFRQGFAEAREKLQALSMLSAEVEASIGKTHDLVLTGIDKLALSHLGHRLVEGSDDPVHVSPAGARAASLGGGAWHVDYRALQAQSFDFALTTRDGDRVSISASRQQAQSLSASAGEWRTASAHSSRFSLTIEGDLSDQERAAIDNLLQQVDDLAAEFYGGDLDSAFASALSLGYDSRHISAFSLNLTRTEIQRASQAYGAQAEASPLQSQLAPLGQFVKNLQQALDSAGVFARPEDLLAQLAERMVRAPERGEQAPSHSFGDFVGQLLAPSQQA